MKRALLVLACLAGCKERGTITVDLSMASTCPMATQVLFQAIKGGSCSACTCGGCTCEDTTEQQCVRDTPCGGTGCTLEDAHANGIEFDPPSAGSYAVTYQFLDATNAAAPRTVAVICTIVTVDADGTQSSTEPGPVHCCM